MTASFLCILVLPLLQFAQDETVNILPATNVSSVLRVAALPVGSALMALLAVVKLFKTSSLGKALLALAIIGAVAGVGMNFQDAVQDLSTGAQLLIFFVGIVGVLVCLGVPISACFGVATVAYLVLAADVDLSVIANRLNEGMSSLILLAVPLFIFLGLLLDSTGLARLMVGFLGNLLGHVRGGLSYVLVGGMYLVSGISGSKAADMAAICPVLFPEMIKRGSKPGDLIALLAATGAQTETVPPSIVLLTIGAVCGVSINALFTGGLLPSLLLGISLCLLVRWRYRKEDLSNVKRATRKEIWKSFLVAIAGARAAVLHPLRRGRRHRHGDRGFDHRHRLLPGRRALLRRPGTAAPEENAGRNRLAHRRHHVHHRLCDGDVLGADPERLLA